MNPDLFLIFPFIVVVTAIVMGTVAKIAKQLMDQRFREKELQAGLHSGPAPQVTARLDEMEQRLRVLERIATDGTQGTALAAEIEALRGDGGTPLVMPQRAGEKAL